MAKIIEPGFEIIEQDISSGLIGMYKHIEQIGRVCYKSEDKITGNSYSKFVSMLLDKKHGAMLEHGTLYLQFPEQTDPPTYYYYTPDLNHFLWSNKYTRTNTIDRIKYVTANYRVIYENALPLSILDFISDCTEYHERRVSVKFTCDRGVSHEFVRNRGGNNDPHKGGGNAFAQESTRYCNYSKKGVVYCRPVWLKNDEFTWFQTLCEENEKQYLQALERGWPPQQARGYLNHFLKTELIITAMMSDWEHFLSLRADSHAHPSAQQLAYPLKEEFIKRGWLQAL